ncbi:MAG: RagB/SusD family nutrient uptake outer membrane protein, partial [Cyclobacteriaceae bacterium]|nr:RagB/SusD family nutrient uptake outer membrane protein [Cyclobacteriaceae bacterium SS2]
MKKYYNKALVVLMTMASACSGLLDQEAISNLTQQDFWKSRDDANAGLTAVYDGLQKTLGSDFLIWGDFRSDEVEFIEGESNPTPDHLLIMRDQLHPRLGPANWSEFYNLIARCNNLLSNVASISDLTEGEKNNFLGQGYFIRALAYFYAVRIWGDVPLILEPYTSSEDDFFVSRTPQNIVLSAIKDDLEEAVNKLPKSSSPNKGTWGGAMALKAHVYAWEKDYNTVVSVTNELINSSIYHLVSTGNYRNIFESENTNESIFELVFDFNSYQEINGIADQFLAQPYSIGLSPRFQPSQSF